MNAPRGFPETVVKELRSLTGDNWEVRFNARPKIGNPSVMHSKRGPLLTSRHYSYNQQALRCVIPPQASTRFAFGKRSFFVSSPKSVHETKNRRAEWHIRRGRQHASCIPPCPMNAKDSLSTAHAFSFQDSSCTRFHTKQRS